MKFNLLYLLFISLAIGGSGCGPKKGMDKSKKTISDNRKNIKNKNKDDDIEEFELMDEMDENFFVDNSTQKTTFAQDKGDDFAWVDVEDDENPGEILFDFDHDEIRPDQKKRLSNASYWSKNVAKKGGNVVVEGHADAIGARDYNLALSERRAKTVAHELIHGGTPKDKIKLVGRGQEVPKVLAPLTPTAQQPNRRVAVYEIK